MPDIEIQAPDGSLRGYLARPEVDGPPEGVRGRLSAPRVIVASREGTPPIPDADGEERSDAET